MKRIGVEWRLGVGCNQARWVGFTGIPSEGAIRKARQESSSADDIDYSAFSGMIDEDDDLPHQVAALPVRSRVEEPYPTTMPTQYRSTPKVYAPSTHIDRLRRDYFKFSKTRPLPQVPWLQDTRRTYLDDAERMFGRKELWHTADHDTRLKLIVILKEFLQDTTKSSNELATQTRERERKLNRLAKEYTSFVVAGVEDPSILKTWRKPKSAADILKEEEAADVDGIQSLREFAGKSKQAPTSEQDDDSETGAHVDAVRNDMLSGNVGGVATGGMTKSSLKSSLPASHRSYSQFPFLRKRAQEDAASLDPSLVDWTKQYFPDDDETTFDLPPSLKDPAAGTPAATDDDDVDDKEVAELRMSNALAAKGDGSELSPRDRQLAAAATSHIKAQKRMRRSGQGRHALGQSLSQKVNARMSVFDAEGVHYRRGVDITRTDPSPGGPSVDSEGIPRTQRPHVLKMRGATDVRDSFLEKRYHGNSRGPSGNGNGSHEVFSADTLAGDRATKVDWSNVSTQRSGSQGSKARGPQWHRANERLIRMTRGEVGDRL